MFVGFLTAPFGKENLDAVLKFAGEAGFDALEVVSSPGSKHIDPAEVDGKSAGDILEKFKDAGVTISSLAYYCNPVDPDPQARKATSEHLKKAIDAAVLLKVEVVCTLAGFPVDGKSKEETIEEDVAEVFTPLVEYAGKRGIKIALENYFRTNIQNLEHWERVFSVVPAPNFGLNFDPSHLLWQGIDYIAAVDRFANRIFHTHAKDCEVKEHRLRVVGVEGGGWWRYVIPGFGKVRWGEYIAALRANGYNGVLSIEHEDGALGREEGFLKGLTYLRQFA